MGWLDYLAARALADEIESRLAGARVQEVLATGPQALGLELYAGTRWYLDLTADGHREGLLLGQQRLRRGAGPPSALVQAARSDLVGARLSAVHQPPWERILHFEFTAAAGRTVVAELTGRMANIVLLDEQGGIRACARRVTAEMTRARTVIPGREYRPPPPQDKVAPDRLDNATMRSLLDDDGPQQPAWRRLVRAVRGVSPMLAREVIQRGHPDAEIGSLTVAEVDALAVWEALQGLMLRMPSEGSWQPTSAWRADPDGGSEHDDDPPEPVSWAAYRPNHLDRRPSVALRSEATVSAALEAYERAQIGSDPYRRARSSVLRAIERVQERLRRKHDALERQVEGMSQAGAQRLRDKGDLILAYQWQVNSGDDVLEVPDAEGATVRIQLDPQLDAVENAQAYYGRYQRAVRALKEVPKRLATARAELATLEQLGSDVELAETRDEIDAVQDALVDGGWVREDRGRRRPKASPESAPRAFVSSDGLTILVGRNSRQNEVVTFDRGARGDPWLHARGLPGSHVVIKAAGRDVPDRTLREAAGLAAWYSKARDDRGVPVILTDVRHVRRMRGGGVGMVTFDHDESLIVDPLPPESLEGG